MSDLSKLKEVLQTQQQKGIKSGDWKPLHYTTTKDADSITISIESLEVGFSFSLRGRLQGIFNWKD